MIRPFILLALPTIHFGLAWTLVGSAAIVAIVSLVAGMLYDAGE
jgi:hypothetical protein